MELTRKISKRGRGMDVKSQKMGSCSTFTPRRSSARRSWMDSRWFIFLLKKIQTAMNYTKVEESFSLSASARLPPSAKLPFQGRKGSKANSPNKVVVSLGRDHDEIEFLQEGFYDNVDVTSDHGVPIRGALDRHIGTLNANLGNFQSHECSTPYTPNRVVASLYDGGSDEVLLDEEVDATSDGVPIGGALDTTERVGDMAFEDEQRQGGRAHNSVASPPTTSHHSATRSINITEMVDLWDDDVYDIESLLGSEADLAYVEGYRVKPKYAEILRELISKHGDIGANCNSKSVAVRSLYMKLICQVVLELEGSSILLIPEARVKEMHTTMCDLEGQNIVVGWLKERLDMILEAKCAIPTLKRSSEARMLKDQQKAKNNALRELLMILSGELSRAESEAKETDMILSESRAKLQRIVKLDTLISGLK